MKVKILYTALISLIAGGAMAQDCTFFFPQTEGTVWVREGYDAKGILQSVMSYQVDPFAPMISFSIRNAIGKTKLAEITPECVLRITNKSFKANSNKEEIIAENC